MAWFILNVQNDEEGEKCVLGQLDFFFLPSIGFSVFVLVFVVVVVVFYLFLQIAYTAWEALLHHYIPM